MHKKKLSTKADVWAISHTQIHMHTRTRAYTHTEIINNKKYNYWFKYFFKINEGLGNIPNLKWRWFLMEYFNIYRNMKSVVVKLNNFYRKQLISRCLESWNMHIKIKNHKTLQSSKIKKHRIKLIYKMFHRHAHLRMYNDCIHHDVKYHNVTTSSNHNIFSYYWSCH